MCITLNKLSIDKIQPVPHKLEDHKTEVQDPLIEYSLGTLVQPKPVYIGNLLTQAESLGILKFLTNYKDCFA